MSACTYHRFTAYRGVNFTDNPDKEPSINSLHESIPDVSRALYSNWRVDQLTGGVGGLTCKCLVNSLWWNLLKTIATKYCSALDHPRWTNISLVTGISFVSKFVFKLYFFIFYRTKADLRSVSSI